LFYLTHGASSQSTIKGKVVSESTGVGYETNIFSFSSAVLPLKLIIKMKIKVKEMENMVLEPFVEEGWDRWGNVFMEQFVGRSANGKNCRIKNENAIAFRYYKRTNRLVAWCDDPILTATSQPVN
jgi:hypothetical protein